MTEVLMPKLSMNMSEGVIIEWFVEDGDGVEEDQELAEIESEKSTSVIEAPTGGRLSIAVPAGSAVEVGATLATIDADVDADVQTETPEPAPTNEQPVQPETETVSVSDPARSTQSRDGPSIVRATPAARRAARERGVAIDAVAAARGLNRVHPEDVEAFADSERTRTQSDESIVLHAEDGQQTGRVRASPAARQAAREHEIELGRLEGSGPDGAIVAADVQVSAQAPTHPEPRPSPEPTAGEAAAAPERHASVRDREELSGVRRVIADRLSQSWRTAPHVTVNREIPVGRTRELKEELERELSVDISLNDLFLLAVGATLDQHPEFNATLEGEHDELVHYDQADIAIAVDTDRGLISPVLRDVGGKSVTELAETRAQLVADTLNGTVPPHRLEGGTFTVTNLGSLGVSSFTPIINPPQVAILGLSAIRQAPRQTDDGDIVFREMLTASLSFDHRAVDGADAARFLETFDERLANPLSLIVD